MSPILYVLIFLSTLLAFEGLAALLQDRQRQNRGASRKRLKRLAANLQAPETIDEESILRAREGLTLADRLFAALPGRESLELRLYRAGMSMTPGRFTTLSLLFGLAGWVAGTILLRDPLLAFACAGFGLLPYMRVASRGRKRARLFEQQFPDALDLLIRALKAGHSIGSGMQMVGNEMPEPVATEFAQVADEIQLGQSLRTSLLNLSYRVESPDLPFFVTAVTIQQETGSNLAEVLENLSSVIRERFKIYGKVRALTAMGRASANLLAAWPFIMVGAMCMVKRSYMAPLWETREGHIMVVVAAVMVVFGYVVCRKMATIRV